MSSFIQTISDRSDASHSDLESAVRALHRAHEAFINSSATMESIDKSLTDATSAFQRLTLAFNEPVDEDTISDKRAVIMNCAIVFIKGAVTPTDVARSAVAAALNACLAIKRFCNKPGEHSKMNVVSPVLNALKQRRQCYGPIQGATHVFLSACFQDFADIEWKPSDFEDVIEISREVQLDPGDLFFFVARYIQLCIKQGRFMEAEEKCRQALSAATWSSNPLFQAELTHNICEIRLRQGQLADAAELLQRSVDFLSTHNSQSNPCQVDSRLESLRRLLTSATLLTSCTLQIQQGRLEEAKLTLKELLGQIQKKSCDEDCVDEAVHVIHQVALIHVKLEQFDRAEERYLEALNLHTTHGSSSDMCRMQRADILKNFACLDVRLGKDAAAIPKLQEALGIYSELNFDSRFMCCLSLAALLHRLGKFAQACDLTGKCQVELLNFLSTSPSRQHLRLFDVRFFAYLSCAHCQFQLSHEPENWSDSVSQLMQNAKVLLELHVQTNDKSPYSLATAVQSLFIKAIKFVHACGSQHPQASHLLAQAHEHLANLMMEQLDPPPLCAAGRHAEAALQWAQQQSPGCPTVLVRLKSLLEKIDCMCEESEWMIDDDVRLQHDAADEALHDIMLQMFENHSIHSLSLEVSSNVHVQNRIPQLGVEVNCILDQAWSRFVVPFSRVPKAEVFFRGDYSSKLAVMDDLRSSTRSVLLPVFKMVHLRELLDNNPSELNQARSKSRTRFCGLLELDTYFRVIDVQSSNLPKFSYRPRHSNGNCNSSNLQSMLKATASRLHHTELYKNVLHRWDKRFNRGEEFEVSPLDKEETWTELLVGLLQKMGWVTRLKQSGVHVNVDKLPNDPIDPATDPAFVPLLDFISESMIRVLLRWLRKVADVSVQPLLADEHRIWAAVIKELKQIHNTRGNPGTVPDNLLQEVCGCFFFARKVAIDAGCKFDDDSFQTKYDTFKSEEASKTLEYKQSSVAAEEAQAAEEAYVAEKQSKGGAVSSQELKKDAQYTLLNQKRVSAGLAKSKAYADMKTAQKDLQHNSKESCPKSALSLLICSKLMQEAIMPTLEESDSLRAYLRSMDFFLYRNEQGQYQGPNEWSKSWSAALVSISVDSKHVRLTPVSQSSNIQQNTNGFSFANQRLNIECISRRSFVNWTFASVLSSLPNAAELSEAIVLALNLERHIVEGRVVHETAVAYRNAVGKNKSTQEIQVLEETYVSDLKDLFASNPALNAISSLPPIMDAVAGVILKKILQESHLRLFPDYCEDAPVLLQKILNGSKMLIQEIGRERYAGEEHSRKERLKLELRKYRCSEILDAIFAHPSAPIDSPMPRIADESDTQFLQSIVNFFEWISKRKREAHALQDIFDYVIGLAFDDQRPFWLRKRLLACARNLAGDYPIHENSKSLGKLSDKLDQEIQDRLGYGAIPEDIRSQIIRCHDILQEIEFNRVLYAGYPPTAPSYPKILQMIQSLTVEFHLKMRAFIEQSLMRSFEGTVLQPRDLFSCSSSGSWDIKFTGAAGRSKYIRWLVSSNVSLDSVYSCDGEWLTCSSVDGLMPGDPLIFWGDSCFGVTVSDLPYNQAHNPLYCVRQVDHDKKRISICDYPFLGWITPFATGLQLIQGVSPGMFVFKGPLMPPCIQRYPKLYEAIEMLHPHKVFASNSDEQRKSEWLILSHLISNICKHVELRDIVLPSLNDPAHHLDLCTVWYQIEGFAFVDAARLALSSCEDAQKLSFEAVEILKKQNILDRAGNPIYVGVIPDCNAAFASLIPDCTKRQCFITEVNRVIAAVRTRWLPHDQRLHAGQGAMAAIRRPLLPSLRAFFDGAFEFSKICADVHRSHFTLKPAVAKDWQKLPGLKFRMESPNFFEGWFQLLLLQDGSPAMPPNPLSFLKDLKSDLQSRLPDFAYVIFFIDSTRMSLRVQCKYAGLLTDIHDAVCHIASQAMPSQ